MFFILFFSSFKRAKRWFSFIVSTLFFQFSLETMFLFISSISLFLFGKSKTVHQMMELLLDLLYVNIIFFFHY